MSLSIQIFIQHENDIILGTIRVHCRNITTKIDICSSQIAIYHVVFAEALRVHHVISNRFLLLLLLLPSIVSRGISRNICFCQLMSADTINKATNERSATSAGCSCVLHCPRNRGAPRNQVSHSPSTTSSPPLHTRAGRDEIMMYATRFLRSSEPRVKAARMYEGFAESA